MAEKTCTKEKTVGQHKRQENPTVVVYALKEKLNDEINRHTLIHLTLPEVSSKDKAAEDEGNTYNIVMVDVSYSMEMSWGALVSSWNSHVATCLRGRTDIYMFSRTVSHVRKEPRLLKEDYIGGNTDLCMALSTIENCLRNCQQNIMKVFLITDGAHTASSQNPETIIERMSVPAGKMCEVFLWGVGNSFPVQCSLAIRSRLHNGGVNIPTLFWSRDLNDMTKEAEDIATHLIEPKLPVKLSRTGCLAPGLPETYDFHMGDWVYIACDPRKVGTLKVSVNKKKRIKCRSIYCQFTIDMLLNFLIPQWNSQLIQIHTLKKPIPSGVFPFMERLFQFFYDEMCEMLVVTKGGISERLLRKEIKTTKLQFQTLVNQSMAILTKEKFMNEVKLAEAILQTTVTTRKHTLKGLKLKGHTEEDYAKDCKVFMSIFTRVKEELKVLQVTPEDCCRVTMTSTIGDLKDEGFVELLKLNKFEFLKSFSISGIPVFSRTRDSTELNPWSYKIDKILTSPFTVLSQVAMEEFASVDGGAVGQKDKEVHLQQDNEDSIYNAVVPVFSADAAKVVEPLVRTNLYAMCASFALLKNPHIIDHTIHLAGLAATWIKTVSDYPVPSERPKFIKERLEMVEVTAMIYLDRPSLVFYLKELLANPSHALMTESPREDSKAKPLKCESLLKPLFLMHLTVRAGRSVDHQIMVTIVRMMAVEFLGRCLTHAAHGNLPFIKYFMHRLFNNEERWEWLRMRVRDFCEGKLLSEESVLQRIYFPQMIAKYVDGLLSENSEAQCSLFAVAIDAMEPKVTGLESLSSVSNCGDVTWNLLQTCALEFGVSKAEVDEIFSENNAFVYTYHALTYTSSRERMCATILDYETCLEKVKARLGKEMMGCAREMIREELCSAFRKRWHEEYDACHGIDIVVRPMRREDIVWEARAKGIEVTIETFDYVFVNYNKRLGLLRNACQSPSCPHYLEPRRSFNQHIAVERRPDKFLHSFHHVVSGEQDIDAKLDLLITSNKDTVETTPELCAQYRKNIETLMLLYQEFRVASGQ
ncbi:uncharacterized protein LOC143027640 [Oratosquilla oratoria]|uniref:uncharacterized protein LOC143027640 n=1 Tax=Oratosquilla oratoria TaxID=337810 RepID=UPI003F75C725